MTPNITLNRTYLPDCTLGIMETQDGFRCVTLELPNLDNQKDISCCPPGLYEYHFRVSEKNGKCLELHHVTGRECIQIHVGNWLKNTLGCILPGETLQLIPGKEPMVTNSGTTLQRLLESVPKEGIIEIR